MKLPPASIQFYLLQQAKRRFTTSETAFCLLQTKEMLIVGYSCKYLTSYLSPLEFLCTKGKRRSRCWPNRYLTPTLGIFGSKGSTITQLVFSKRPENLNHRRGINVPRRGFIIPRRSFNVHRR